MSGLTVIGDIQVLYDSIQELETASKQDKIDLDSKYSKLISGIVSRLEKLEEFCYQDKILNESDSSWEIVRAKRDYLLKSTDWTATNGCTASPMAWVEYRQQLRDLPQTFADNNPEDVIWPEQPSALGPHTIEE